MMIQSFKYTTKKNPNMFFKKVKQTQQTPGETLKYGCFNGCFSVLGWAICSCCSGAKKKNPSGVILPLSGRIDMTK